MFQIDVSDNLSIEVIPNVDETHPPTICIQDNFNSEKYAPNIYLSEPEHICVLQNELFVSANIAKRLSGKQSGTLRRVTKSWGFEIQIVFDSFRNRLGFDNVEGLPIILVCTGYSLSGKLNAISVYLSDVSKLLEGLEKAYKLIRKSQSVKSYNRGTLELKQRNYAQAIVYLKKGHGSKP